MSMANSLWSARLVFKFRLEILRAFHRPQPDLRHREDLLSHALLQRFRFVVMVVVRVQLFMVVVRVQRFIVVVPAQRFVVLLLPVRKVSDKRMFSLRGQLSKLGADTSILGKQASRAK